MESKDWCPLTKYGLKLPGGGHLRKETIVKEVEVSEMLRTGEAEAENLIKSWKGRGWRADR